MDDRISFGLAFRPCFEGFFLRKIEVLTGSARYIDQVSKFWLFCRDPNTPEVWCVRYGFLGVQIPS